MSAKQQVLDALDKYLGGGYTWGGKYTSWIPYRDQAKFDQRVTKTKALRARVAALTEVDDALAFRLRCLVDGFEADVLDADCSSNSLQLMLKDIHECAALQFEVVSNPAFAVETPTATMPQGADETKQEAGSLALVRVDQPVWHYRGDYVGAEAFPEDDATPLSMLFRRSAQMVEDATRNMLLNERGVANFKQMDFFQRLGVEQHASADDIRHAYHKLSRRFHPDKVSALEQRQFAQTIMGLLNEAHTTLSDGEARGRYTAMLLAQELRATVELTQPELDFQPGCMAMLGLCPIIPGLVYPMSLMIALASSVASTGAQAVDALEDMLNPADVDADLAEAKGYTPG